MTASAFGPITACPSCGVVSSENYGAGCCWVCFCKVHPGAAAEPERELWQPDWVRFRRSVFAAMRRDGAWEYLSADRVGGRCPLCRDVMAVEFPGRRPAARFLCRSGCDADEIAGALGKGGER